MTFLVQMRQSNNCWSVRNDEILNLNLEFGVSPWPTYTEPSAKGGRLRTQP